MTSRFVNAAGRFCGAAEGGGEVGSGIGFGSRREHLRDGEVGASIVLCCVVVC